jgi:hypothetical protein
VRKARQERNGGARGKDEAGQKRDKQFAIAVGAMLGAGGTGDSSQGA